MTHPSVRSPGRARLSGLALVLVLGLGATHCDADGRGEKAPEPAAVVKSAPEPAKAPAPTPAARPEGPGQLDATLVADASRLKGLEKIKLDVNADGSLRYMAVYHHDEAVATDAVKGAQPAEFANATVQLYESEFRADVGRVVEVELKTEDNRECEYSVKADSGELVYTECKLPSEELPEAVQKAVASTFAGSAIKEAELVTRTGGSEEYGVSVEIDGAEHEIYVDKSGNVLRHVRYVPAKIGIPVK